jgi:YD repeat-containing protein
MALDGHEFWLSRADGGSVHFFGVYQEPFLGHLRWVYQATEVFDPNGFKTTLTYDQYGNLSQVRQEGGRYLTIHWGGVGFALPVIVSVDSGSDYGLQSQHISYGYSTLDSGLVVLTSVTYPDEPAPGRTSSAYYTYDMLYGDDPNSADQEPNSFPLLKYAVDPHFGGAMTKIGYKYWGKACHTHPPHNCGAPCANWFYFTPETVIAERSKAHYNTVVSSFDPHCETGSRYEADGIGCWLRVYLRSCGGAGAL